MPRLTQRDLAYLQQAISGETLTYLGHAMTDRNGLRPTEQTHLDYLLGLNERLDLDQGKHIPKG